MLTLQGLPFARLGGPGPHLAIRRFLIWLLDLQFLSIILAELSDSVSSMLVLVNTLVHFEWFGSGFQRYGSVDKSSMMKFALEDLRWMILMPKFWYIGQISFRSSAFKVV
jgi:hypothetical protein